MAGSSVVEKTYLVIHPTRLAYLKWYLIALFFILFGVFVISSVFGTIKFNLPIPKNYNIYTISIPSVGIIFIVIASLMRSVETYYITNYRMIEKKGIINIKEDSIYWEKISNYSLSQSAIERIFNIGTIHLHAMAGGMEDKEAEIVIKRVSNVHKIEALLDTLIKRK
jgi:uncharacterized membrane protein YdbT with pleckstrin-like domain